MPIDYKHYPTDWDDISRRIRKRSKGRCECKGECGKHPQRCTARHNHPHPVTNTNVVLTVAHLGTPHPDGRAGNKHDKLDCRDENLKAMCQRCHLLFDLDDHVKHAAETRRQKKIDAGQMELNLL